MITLWLNLAVAAPPSTLPSRPVSEKVAPVPVPESAVPLRGLLSARHTSDLPSLSAIEANGGLPALRWLAEHDGHAGIRVRALDLLARHAPDRTLCLDASGEDQLEAIQAAGLRCLSQLKVLDADAAEVVTGNLTHPDPRVQAEARRAATRHDLARPHSHVRPRELEPVEVASP